MTNLLSLGNSKLKHCGKAYNLKIAAFDIPAGFTCPAANLCHSRAIVDETGKAHVVDYGNVRCFAASIETVYKNVRDAHWRNLDASKSDSFIDTISAELRKYKIQSVRIHASGDFYSLPYLLHWVKIAQQNPDITFWGYTKMASFIKILNAQPNMRFVYSMGGKMDDYAVKHNLPRAYIITDNAQAVELGIPVACTPAHKSNDYEHIMGGNSFALMIHGTQPKGAKSKKVKSF